MNVAFYTRKSQPRRRTGELSDAEVVGAGPEGDEAFDPQAVRVSERPEAIEGAADTVAPASPRNHKAWGLNQISADRPIFTLSVATDLLGLHPRTLRIYEEKGLVVPARAGGNRRRYSQNDIERFIAIRTLTKAGVNLEGVRIILDLAQEISRLGGDPNAIIDRTLEALDASGQ